MSNEFTLNTHESAFVIKFLPPDRRERFLEALANPKRREVFHRHLHHPKDGFLIAKYILPIKPSEQYPRFVIERLEKLGAPPECWTFGNRLDGKRMPLEEALDVLIGGRSGTIASCIPGKLAYFESEEDRVILYAS
jgi:DNA-binding transcriptional ArsR family regulator